MWHYQFHYFSFELKKKWHSAAFVLHSSDTWGNPAIAKKSWLGAALCARYKRNDTNVHYAIQDDKNFFEMITSLTGSMAITWS